MARLNVKITEQVREAISFEIVRSHRMRSTRDIKMFLTGRLILEEAKFAVKGRTSWSKGIKRLKEFVDESEGEQAE